MPPARVTPVRGATLAQLVARQTPIEWFEAVAIVQGVCATLLDSASAGSRGVPDAEDVAITPEGGVELLAVGSREAPVARVARLLHGLAEGTAIPVQLRLLVLQELSPSPGCASILQFSTRLALFERPGRANLIRGVYERFVRLPPRQAESLIGAARPAAPPPEARAPWWRRRVVHGAAAAGLLLLVLSGAAIWMWRAVSPPPAGSVDRRGPVARAVTAARASVSEAAAGSARAVSRWLGSSAAAKPAAPQQPAAAIEPPAPGPAARPRRPVTRVPELSVPGPEPARLEVPDPRTPDVTVYSNVNSEVVPPSLVRSRLPESPPLGLRPDALPEVEVVVSASGDVESARLITEQAGVLPAMMLSAIKSWRFHPATRDGEPVRYRLRMRLTNQ